jgi:hypothetical protein
VIFHISGFINDDPTRSTKVGTYDGSGPNEMARIANAVLDRVAQEGHEVKRSHLRTLGGMLVEAHATVKVAGTDSVMWHLFTERTETWPTEPLSPVARPEK